jgi:hypothetical protein
MQPRGVMQLHHEPPWGDHASVCAAPGASLFFAAGPKARRMQEELIMAGLEPAFVGGATAAASTDALLPLWFWLVNATAATASSRCASSAMAGAGSLRRQEDHAALADGAVASAVVVVPSADGDRG